MIFILKNYSLLSTLFAFRPKICYKVLNFYSFLSFNEGTKIKGKKSESSMKYKPSFIILFVITIISTYYFYFSRSPIFFAFVCVFFFRFSRNVCLNKKKYPLAIGCVQKTNSVRKYLSLNTILSEEFLCLSVIRTSFASKMISYFAFSLIFFRRLLCVFFSLTYVFVIKHETLDLLVIL